MRNCYLIFLLALPTYGADLLANAGGVPITVNTWTQMTPSGATGWKCVGWEKLQFIPLLDAAIAVCNYREISSEPNRSLMTYSLAENKMVVLDNSSTWHNEHMAEGGHPVAGSSVDITSNILYGHGNFSGSQVSERPQSSWLYDFVGQTGRNMEMATKPNYNIQQPAGSFAPLQNQHIEHGGDSGFTGTNVYNVDLNTWSRGVTCTAVAANCPAPGLLLASTATRTVDGKIYLFGGTDGTLKNSVFAYNPDAQTWAAVTLSGTPPSARQKAGFVYMKNVDKFLMYGGEDSGGVDNETWILDPVALSWTQVTPAASPSTPSSGPFERMTYFDEWGAVVLFNIVADTQVWAYCYIACSPAGTASQTYTKPAGSLNHNSDSWAESPNQASNGTLLCRGWVETGVPADATDGRWFWPYVQCTNGSTTTNYGSAYNSMATGAANLESGDISVTMISSNPWACWHQQNNSSFGLDQVAGKGWDGNSWEGTLIGQLTVGASSFTQGPCQIIDVAGTPTMIVKERAVEAFTPARVYLYVLQWDGNSWEKLGGAWNRIGDASNQTQIESLSLFSNGTYPCAAWTEYTTTTITNGVTDVNPQAFSSCWDGMAIVSLGGSLSVSGSNRTYEISSTYMGQPYVMITERTATGMAKLYLRTTADLTNWTTLCSGALNRDATTGWAFHPSLINDGTDLYFAWEEQGNQQSEGPTSFGQKSQILVGKYSGGSCTNLGGSVNASTSEGSATHPSLAILNSQVVALWSEVEYGTFRSIYTKTWNGSNWSGIEAGTGPPGSSLNKVTITGVVVK